MASVFADALDAYDAAIGLTPDLTINGNVSTNTTVNASHGGQTSSALRRARRTRCARCLPGDGRCQARVAAERRSPAVSVQCPGPVLEGLRAP
jgi:hypothetical protein